MASVLMIVIAGLFYTCQFFMKEITAQPVLLANSHGIYSNNLAPYKDYLYLPQPTDEVEVEKEQFEIPFFEIDDSFVKSIPEGKVALTFDDGPSEYTRDIVNTLKQYEVGGTFFLIGQYLDKYPEEVAYIHENGYTIGTHSMNHINFSNSSTATQEYELQQSIEAIEAIIGEEITLFRPPFGQFNDITESVSSNLGQRMILWNNDPKDWQSRDAKKIIQHIKSSDVSGSIIILHEYPATLEALPEIITYLQAQGLELVNLR